jgi:hypothetical protein
MWLPTVSDRRHNAKVPLEHQIVQVGRDDRAQRRHLGAGLVLVEHVQGPLANGGSAQVRMVEATAVVRVQGDRLDAGSSLFRPGQQPAGAEAAVRGSTEPGLLDVAGFPQQPPVELTEHASSVWRQQSHRRVEQCLLVRSAHRRVTVPPVPQIGEMPQ